ncbi:DUF1835 domain-containing protein [Lysinibacillus sp. NPDC097231]|uniref:DUF1835 domain-containing protein n=1 Tax=Lysinibacillus sp. NPDC097231 TaxID=3364142 RepID=UPI003812B3C9
MEPTTVFVYKIKTQNYLCATDLMNDFEWKSYELQQNEQFEAFQHVEREPLKGWTFCLEQEELIKMVEVINDNIQKHRSTYQEVTNTPALAVHIVCSESEAGSVRVALEPPKYVIGFPDFFSIGPLWKLEEEKGQAIRNTWLFENINDEQDDYVYLNKFTNALREIEDIPYHVPIYIWYGNNAHEQSGLRYILYLLRNKTNEIFLINTTEHHERFNSPVFYTSQIESQQLKHLFTNIKDQKPLTAQERLYYQKEWEKLSQMKDILRLWMDNEIKGVSENHYDSLIIETINRLHQKQETKDFIQTGTVIMELLPLMDEMPSVFFLEYRIRYLVYSGILALKGIPKSMRHYSVKLRK